MAEIEYKKLASGDASSDSLDGFVRHHDVRECWRKIDGEWKLLPIAFTEDWDIDYLRKEALSLMRSISDGQACFGAFDGASLRGYAILGDKLFNDAQGYIALVCMQVSAPYRGRHIGSVLFKMCADEARALGARKLYISAHSSKESQAFYRAVGCVEAQEYDAEAVRLEPCDVQMEYQL